MRVAELIARLGELDPSWDVLLHAEHGECQYQFFDIEGVKAVKAVRSRDEEGNPKVQIDAEKGRPQALLTLTAEF
jgi:hypothetical protein